MCVQVSFGISAPKMFLQNTLKTMVSICGKYRYITSALLKKPVLLPKHFAKIKAESAKGSPKKLKKRRAPFVRKIDTSRARERERETSSG